MKILKGNKGIKREAMPQLRGFPIPNSLASKLQTSSSGKVDVTEAFLGWLCAKGVTMKHDMVTPRKVKATQNQLLKDKVDLQVEEMLLDPEHKKFTMPYIVSKDGFLLDGHHGWASVIKCNKMQKKKTKIHIIKVDLPIKALLKKALKFTNNLGIAAKSA